jgi:hypothetical protein
MAELTDERGALRSLLEAMQPHFAVVLQADYPDFKHQLDGALATGDESRISEVFGRFPALQDEMEKALAGEVSLKMATQAMLMASEWSDHGPDDHEHSHGDDRCGCCGE